MVSCARVVYMSSDFGVKPFPRRLVWTSPAHEVHINWWRWECCARWALWAKEMRCQRKTPQSKTILATHMIDTSTAPPMLSLFLKWVHVVLCCLVSMPPLLLSALSRCLMLHRRRCLPLQDCTAWDLMLRLTDEGWKMCSVKGAAHLKSLPPYSRDSPAKLWYSTGKAPSVHYLRALLQADEILAKGQPSLHHLQPQSYYILLGRAHLSA